MTKEEHNKLIEVISRFDNVYNMYQFTTDFFERLDAKYTYNNNIDLPFQTYLGDIIYQVDNILEIIKDCDDKNKFEKFKIQIEKLLYHKDIESSILCIQSKRAARD